MSGVHLSFIVAPTPFWPWPGRLPAQDARAPRAARSPGEHNRNRQFGSVVRAYDFKVWTFHVFPSPHPEMTPRRDEVTRDVWGQRRGRTPLRRRRRGLEDETPESIYALKGWWDFVWSARTTSPRCLSLLLSPASAARRHSAGRASASSRIASALCAGRARCASPLAVAASSLR